MIPVYSVHRSLSAVDSDGYVYRYFPCHPGDLGADRGTCDPQNHVAVSCLFSVVSLTNQLFLDVSDPTEQICLSRAYLHELRQPINCRVQRPISFPALHPSGLL